MNPYTKIKDFYAARAKSVGSSDIPVLAGLTKRYGQTPYTLWLVKTGRQAPWAGNEKTWWGHVHENSTLYKYVLDRYDEEIAARFLASKLRGRSLGELRVRTECRHPQYRFALAHADLLIADEPHIVEAKSHGFYAAKRREDDPDFGYDQEDLSQQGLPAAIFLQMQWQLFVYGVERGTVPALIDTNRYAAFGPVISDSKVQEQELALAERFIWHIEHDTPPQPQTWADVQGIYPHPQETTAMLGGEQEELAREMVARWHRAGERIDAGKAEREDIKSALGVLLGENKVLAASDGTRLASSWEQANPPSVDLKRLEAEWPEVYQAVVRRTTRRELRPANLGG